MKCALWLNRKKVQRASEIPDNLDIASLRGYFLAGSLIEWLNENGGEEYAGALKGISADDERLNDKLVEAFGGEPLPAKPLDGTYSENSSETRSKSSFTSGSFGSFGGWEWLFGSLSKGSFGSFYAGSFHEWEWEWLYRLFLGNGSFTGGSFGGSSFTAANGLFGSLAPLDIKRFDELDEYDRIMLKTLALCPLDRFGYGIHNI